MHYQLVRTITMSFYPCAYANEDSLALPFSLDFLGKKPYP